MTRARIRDIGVQIGTRPTGLNNAITDVSGVKVGYSTLIRDEPTVVRTGVTAIWPSADIFERAVFAGVHNFNGYGEMTGTLWIDEQGLLAAPICITNTYAVGIVRDAVCEYGMKKSRERGLEEDLAIHLPVVAETYDGFISDISSMPVTKEMTFEALDSATGGAIAEGNVGGGTGMVCHEFKGGTGTSSRITDSGYTVGAIVQANYGRREFLTIAGVPVGRTLSVEEVPSPARKSGDAGSIIIIIATDAPLLPIQCQRLAERATVGLARAGSIGADASGDIFLAFSTGNKIVEDQKISSVEMLSHYHMSELFLAAAEAVEEAILNALCAAETLSGYKGRTAYQLPLDRTVEILRDHRVIQH